MPEIRLHGLCNVAQVYSKCYALSWVTPITRLTWTTQTSHALSTTLALRICSVSVLTEVLLMFSSKTCSAGGRRGRSEKDECSSVSVWSRLLHVCHINQSSPIIWNNIRACQRSAILEVSDASCVKWRISKIRAHFLLYMTHGDFHMLMPTLTVTFKSLLNLNHCSWPVSRVTVFLISQTNSGRRSKTAWVIWQRC